MENSLLKRFMAFVVSGLKDFGKRAQMAGVALGSVIAIVALFIGLFMISKVSDITALNNTSSFYTTYTKLITSTGTVYDVITLVIIIFALGIAIAVLRGFSETAGGAGGTIQV